MIESLPIIALLCWMALLGLGEDAPQRVLLIMVAIPLLSLMLVVGVVVDLCRCFYELGNRCIRFHFEDI